MRTIAIDIDDVLADSAKGFVEFSNSQWGTNLTPEDYDEHWMKVWQVDEAEAHRRADLFHSSGVVAGYLHHEESLPVLKRLSQSYRLIIVTSRRLSIQGDTLQWLKNHYPGVFEEERIHFAGFWDGKVNGAPVTQTKAELCKDLGVSYLIDDQLKHCIGAAESGIQAILFGDYNWNRADALPDNITRLLSWPAIGEYFDVERG